MPSEPTTQRAAALIEEWYPGGGDGLDADELAAFRAALAAIEAEARLLADELAEALAAVRETDRDGGPCWCAYYDGTVHLVGCVRAVAALAKWEASRGE